MSAIEEQKAALRAEAKARRAQIAHNDRWKAGQAAAQALFSPRMLNLLSRFRFFASYLSTHAEFPTDEIHEALFQSGTSLCVPRFSSNQKVYQWSLLRPGEPLKYGPNRITEPLDYTPFPKSEIEVALVPGLLFDTLGGRLGYGAGIYDRLLAGLRPGTLRIGLAFDCQVRKEPLPQEPHDLPMNYLVTDHYWIDCTRARRARREAHV